MSTKKSARSAECRQRVSELRAALDANRKELKASKIVAAPDAKPQKESKALEVIVTVSGLSLALGLFWYAGFTASTKIARGDVLCFIQPGKPDSYIYTNAFGSVASMTPPIVLPGGHVNCIRTDEIRINGDATRQFESAMQNSKVHDYEFRRTTARNYEQHIYPAYKPPAHKLGYEMWKEISIFLQQFLALAGVLGAGLFFYAIMTRRKYMWKNDLGLAISYDVEHPKNQDTFIPWHCLRHVKVTGMPVPCVELEFDHGPKERIKWSDIVSHIEPGEFINALRTWAPHAVQDCIFPTQNGLSGVDDHTFTKLWFKYYSTGTQRERAGQLAAGDELQDGRFKVLERVGGGGQGTAYLATDNRGAQAARLRQEQAGSLRSQILEVVLKEYILPVHRGQKVMEQAAQKLQQESEILCKIDHPNIVKLLDEFTEDHRGYLVMEYVHGVTLKTLVAQEGPQPEATVRKWAMQICDILEYLHTMDPPIIHRDLTPDNLILQNDGVIKLVDFNVAHQLESQATATVVGKHAYIPPEQFRGKATAQSDLYALGCTVHFLLTGEEPQPITVSHPQSLNDQISAAMDEVVSTCTAMKAEARYADAAAAKQALEKGEAGEPVKISIASTRQLSTSD